jgi:tRNA G37 N-methylase Trm5
LEGKDFLGDLALAHDSDDDTETGQESPAVSKLPRHYDIIGDVALLHALPEHVVTEEDMQELGAAILTKNPRLRICALRRGRMEGDEKKAPIQVLAGKERTPLLTTHVESGVNYVVNIGECFFSPRMGLERLRLCNSVGRKEEILVLFAGCGCEALQIAVKTEGTEISRPAPLFISFNYVSP